MTIQLGVKKIRARNFSKSPPPVVVQYKKNFRMKLYMTFRAIYFQPNCCLLMCSLMQKQQIRFIGDVRVCHISRAHST